MFGATDGRTVSAVVRQIGLSFLNVFGLKVAQMIVTAKATATASITVSVSVSTSAVVTYSTEIALIVTGPETVQAIVTAPVIVAASTLIVVKIGDASGSISNGCPPEPCDCSRGGPRNWIFYKSKIRHGSLLVMDLCLGRMHFPAEPSGLIKRSSVSVSTVLWSSGCSVHSLSSTRL
jgi:hypothetical protein